MQPAKGYAICQSQWRNSWDDILCSERGDLVTASLLENRLEEVEGRTWFLVDIMHDGEEA
jgi:DNA-binding ferritin-like protein